MGPRAGRFDILKSLDITEVARFAFPGATRPEAFEEQTDVLFATHQKAAYTIINCYVDICYVALAEGRPRPSIHDVAIAAVFEDVDLVAVIITEFARSLGAQS